MRVSIEHPSHITNPDAAAHLVKSSGINTFRVTRDDGRWSEVEIYRRTPQDLTTWKVFLSDDAAGTGHQFVITESLGDGWYRAEPIELV